MIIQCDKCKKKFKIDRSMVPNDGRELQCGSCHNIWFYKPTNDTNKPLTLSEDISFKENEPKKSSNNDEEINKNSQTLNKNKSKIREQEKNKIKEKKEIADQVQKPENKVSKFFSYLVVTIISLVALIILLDTLKALLIDIFPSLEVYLFSLYETLQDIKLFIIDLS